MVQRRRGYCVLSAPSKSKYQRWYEALCAKAGARAIPTCYTEEHHILPRSLGGSDDPSNLVRLEYREHYLAHWLLTKFHTGPALYKMLKALGAMGMQASGDRRATGWRVDLAKRTVRDLELDDGADRRRKDKRNAAKLAAIEAEKQYEAEAWIDTIETAKMFSAEILEEVLTRKAKRESDLKKYGWHPMPLGMAAKKSYFSA